MRATSSAMRMTFCLVFIFLDEVCPDRLVLLAGDEVAYVVENLVGLIDRSRVGEPLGHITAEIRMYLVDYLDAVAFGRQFPEALEPIDAHVFSLFRYHAGSTRHANENRIVFLVTRGDRVYHHVAVFHGPG